MVYSPRAMDHLRTRGTTVWLDLSLPLLVNRLRDMESRGIVIAPGQNLADLDRERRPLYKRYADIRISCDRKGHEQVLQEILSTLRTGAFRQKG